MNTKTLTSALTYHGGGVNPRVERVARHAQVRLVELVVLGPAQRHVAQAFLHNACAKDDPYKLLYWPIVIKEC